MRTNQATGASFSNIYRVLRLLGTASVLTTALSLLRNKSFALFLGPAGFGLFGLLQSLIGTAANLGGFGVGYSATRIISKARNNRHYSHAYFFEMCLTTLGHRLALVTALVTALALHAWNKWHGDTNLDTLLIAAVALGAGLSILASVAITRLQTRRSPARLAVVFVLAAALHTLIAIPIAIAMGEGGVGIIAAVIPLALWIVATRALRAGNNLSVSMANSARNRKVSAIIFSRGVPLMLPGLVDSAGAFSVRLLGVAALGLAAMGQAFAALALSAFVLGTAISAMNQDFLPRLCEGAGDNEKLYRLASEQLLVTVYLAAPILLLVCTFSVETTLFMFSTDFADTAAMVPIMALLVIAQVALWPIQTIQTALGRASQQLIGTIANTVCAVFLIAVFFTSITVFGFALVLVCGALAQLVVQSVLLWRATGICYRLRDWLPMFTLACLTGVLALTRGRWLTYTTIAGCLSAFVWAGLAVRHYILHRK